MIRKEILELFLKFILTQITILIVVEELNRLITSSLNDFNYEAFGPYMMKTSRIPEPNSCYEFYNPDIDLVYLYGKAYTHDEYMGNIREVTLNHNQSLEFPMAIISLIIGLVIQLVGFVQESSMLVLVDNLFTLLLPHFTLYANTVSWGDLCIENSDIFNILDYQTISLIPFITMGCLVVTVLGFVMIVACQIDANGLCVISYVVIVCVFCLYILTIDLIAFYCSPKLVLSLFLSKFAVTGVLLASMYHII